MNARSSSAALLAVLLTAACSAATPAPDAPEAVPAGEQLLGQPPAGWRQVGATNLPSLRRAEFIPETETEDADAADTVAEDDDAAGSLTEVDSAEPEDLPAPASPSDEPESTEN